MIDISLYAYYSIKSFSKMGSQNKKKHNNIYP